MSNIDDVIRDLAEVHGHSDVSEETIREVRATLSNHYLDGMLDTPVQSDSEEVAQYDGKTECS
jgi:hypothetical protein